jgi:hypothetical protein
VRLYSLEAFLRIECWNNWARCKSVCLLLNEVSRMSVVLVHCKSIMPKCSVGRLLADLRSSETAAVKFIEFVYVNIRRH